MNYQKAYSIVDRLSHEKITPEQAASESGVDLAFFKEAHKTFQDGDLMGVSQADWERVTEEYAQELAAK